MKSKPINYAPYKIKKDNNIKSVIEIMNYRHQSNSELLAIYNHYHPDIQRYDNNYHKKIKIVIYAPPLDIECGGIMVLYNMARTLHHLCKKSEIESIIYVYNHRKDCNSFYNNFYDPNSIDDNTIVIYPETIIGNPLNAKNVIRWILLDIGLEVSNDYYKYWSKTDLVYHWEPSKLKNTKQLVNIYINPNIINNNINTRDYTCWALKKMQWIPHSLHHNGINKYHSDNSINIDSMKNHEVINTFNKSSIFYCYDPNTFYTIMAPLCGCVTVLHPIHGMSKKDYFSSRIVSYKDEFTYDAGIAYGNDSDEIKNAINTVQQSKEDFNTLCSLYQNTVNDFISDIKLFLSGKPLINTVKNIYYE